MSASPKMRNEKNIWVPSVEEEKNKERKRLGFFKGGEKMERERERSWGFSKRRQERVNGSRKEMINPGLGV